MRELLNVRCEMPKSAEPATGSSMSWRRLILAVSLLAMAPVESRAQQAASKQALSVLEQKSGAPLSVSNSLTTGLPSFIGTQPGHAIELPVSASADAAARANAFLEMAAPSLGLASAKDVQWRSTSGPDEVAMEHVRFVQTHREVPVAGADLVVHLRGASLVSANGLVLPGIDVVTTPTLAGEKAANVARSAAQASRTSSSSEPVSLSKPRLEILNVGFYERREPGETRLAWFFEATATAYREYIWVDAREGKVLYRFSQLTESRNRRAYTAGGSSSLPGTLVRAEGSGPSGDADVDFAYDYSGDTYDYYSAEHARDSYNNAGATLSSTVDWCDAGLCGSCPCQNAFWDGTQMIYGDGFPAADDVVAHELTHAVTENSANLVYCLQSGALNESFSDIFGETVDLSNTGGTDTMGVRWLLGEDVPGFGAIRNMSNPNAFGDPGKASDAQFLCATSCSDYDNGGVHINSGVPNHAYALMVDGGTYNSVTVTGIGLTKAGKVQYRALTQYLTTNSIFVDDYNALNQSCQDLVGTAGITAGDCTEVMEALQAVEMDTPPCVPSVCGDGSIDGSEECDDNNLTDCDGCDSNCRVTGCGNNLTACGEACDDGNVADGDGCESDCTLSPGCAIYSATGLPVGIPDLSSVTSVINVPVNTGIADVAVLNLGGTHSYVGDLEFHLQSPAGTNAVLVNNVCGGLQDFSLGLDDEAGTPIPCPPTDGLSHIPASALSVFDGQLSGGNWTLSILDQAGGDIGTLQSWDLLICSTPCGDGDLDPGEQCDDGNLTSCDGCDSNCTNTACGNGVVACGEECDDGDVDPGDGCESDCTFTAGCAIYTATDVPRAIPDYSSTQSVVSVTEAGLVTDVDVVDLSGTHTYVSDLRFELMSPDGTSAVVVGNVCGVNDDFDLDLDDEAGAAITCPPTDGGAHVPTQALSLFDGDSSAGDWILTVSDLASADVGSLSSWRLRVCTTPVCAPEPLTSGCLEAGAASLSVTDNASDEKDSIKWKWNHGASVMPGDLGDPTSSARYTLCIYDHSTGTPGLAAALNVPPGVSWSNDLPKGFSYKDRTGGAAGVQKLSVRTGESGKSKAQLGAKGSTIPMPSLFSVTEMFDFDPKVTVQLVNGDGTCWTSDMTIATRNSPEGFKAKAE